MARKGRAKAVKSLSLSIPEIARTINFEKIIETVPVKLWPSLATYVREHGGSELIRKALVDYLLVDPEALEC